MKKTLFTVLGLIALFVMLFNVSCSHEPDITEVPEQKSEVKTGETFDKTVLTAIAYPGMNFISWTPVVAATDYKLYIHEGDVCINSVSFLSTDPLCYIDTNIKNNVQYNYLVEVKCGGTSISDNNSSNVSVEVFPKSMSNKATVTAIVPDYNVNALDLVNYEEPAGNRDFIVNSRNINIAKHNNDKISVSFPGKAYLNYDLFLTVDNEYEALKEYNETELEKLSDNAKNDVILYTNFLVTQAGTYRARVVAKSENDHFGDSDVITSQQTVKVYKLNGSGADIVSADYISYSEIKLTFKKFYLENGEAVPNTYYKLYRSEAGSKNYTQLYSSYNEPELQPHSSDDTLYIVDNVDSKNTKDYIYTLVVTDGSLYAESSSEIKVNKYIPEKRTAYFKDQDGQSINSITVKEGYNSNWNGITLPSIQEKEGYFAKWKSATGDLYNPNEYVSLTGTSTYFTVVYERTAYFLNEYGNTIDSITVEEKSYSNWNRITLPYISERGGYYAYWLSDGNIYEPDDYVYLTSETTYFTVAYGRTAYFQGENGDTINSVTVIKDNSNSSNWNEIILPSIQEKEGYFAKWKSDTGSLHNQYESVFLSSESTSFTAVYGRTAYFQDESGNFIDSVTVIKDNSTNWNRIRLPYSGSDYYSYWRSDNGTSYNSYDYVELTSGTTSFTAVYGRIAYFQDEYGDTINTKIVTADGSSNWNRIRLPSISYNDGYTGYWLYNDTFYEPKDYVELTSETTYFTAVYGRTAYFQDESGNTIDSITVEEKSYSNWNRITLPSISERDGYTGYWLYNDTFYNPYATVSLTSETTYFTAVYGRTAYFHDEYGYTINSKIVTDNGFSDWNRITLPYLEGRDGYYAYWYSDDGTSYNSYDYVELTSETICFTAAYGRTAYFQDESGNTIDSKTVIDDGSSNWYEITLPYLEEIDGFFAKWKSDTGSLHNPNESVSLTSGTTYFTAAYYIVETNDPIETFETRYAYFWDEYGNIIDSTTVTDDGSSDWYEITLPYLEERDGYYAYWYSDDGSYNPYDTVSLTSDTTSFTATYYAAETRYAYFQDEYGNTIDSTTVTDDGSSNWYEITLPYLEERDGYYAYWYSDDGNSYNPYDTVSLTSDTTSFTALYEEY